VKTNNHLTHWAIWGLIQAIESKRGAMRYFLALCAVLISSCGMAGVYVESSYTSVSMMHEMELKIEPTWKLCQVYKDDFYRNSKITGELKRRNALESCQSKGVVEWSKDSYYSDDLSYKKWHGCASLISQSDCK